MTFVRAADGRRVLHAALVLGLVLRAAIFWHTPGLGLEIVDGQHYVALARNILDGHGFAIVPGQPTSIRPPLFPGVLAGIFAVAGPSNLQAVRLVQIIIALLSTALVYQLGRRLFTPAVGRYAAAAMDLSDGLVKDMERMLRGSGVGGRLRAGDVPLSEPARKVLAREPERLAQLITGGDDYEMLAAVLGSRGYCDEFRAAAANAGVPLTEIGMAGPFAWPERGDGLLVERPDGCPLVLDRAGWDHF